MRRGSGRRAGPGRRADQPDPEDEGRVGRDDDPTGWLVRRALRAIAERRRDAQASLAADLHAGHAFIPTTDDLRLADLKCERGSTRLAARVEGVAVREPPGVLDGRVLPALGHLPGADLQVGDLEAVRIGDPGSLPARVEVVGARRDAWCGLGS